MIRATYSLNRVRIDKGDKAKATRAAGDIVVLDGHLVHFAKLVEVIHQVACIQKETHKISQKIVKILKENDLRSSVSQLRPPRKSLLNWMGRKRRIRKKRKSNREKISQRGQ